MIPQVQSYVERLPAHYIPDTVGTLLRNHYTILDIKRCDEGGKEYYVCAARVWGYAADLQAPLRASDPEEKSQLQELKHDPALKDEYRFHARQFDFSYLDKE